MMKFLKSVFTPKKKTPDLGLYSKISGITTEEIPLEDIRFYLTTTNYKLSDGTIISDKKIEMYHEKNS